MRWLAFSLGVLAMSVGITATAFSQCPPKCAIRRHAQPPGFATQPFVQQPIVSPAQNSPTFTNPAPQWQLSPVPQQSPPNFAYTQQFQPQPMYQSQPMYQPPAVYTQPPQVIQADRRAPPNPPARSFVCETDNMTCNVRSSGACRCVDDDGNSEDGSTAE